ncbi:MAG: aminoglycoside phosphotransferase family protein [Thermoanaerobaculia bacterium]
MADKSLLPDEATAFLRQHLGEDWTARALAGDASVRAYYRISCPDGTTYMLAWYPEEVRPQLQRFLSAYRAVGANAHIPALLQYGDAEALQQDVGDRTLFDILREDRAEGVRLYRDAIDLLIAFQRCGAADINPAFTADFFEAELEMARDFYVGQLMEAPRERSRKLRPLFRKLAEKIAQHPYLLCHRDFHGQNIHALNGKLYLIDYQDLRMGPDTYDLASLLRDRGVARIIGEQTELDLVEEYRRKRGADAGIRQRYFETLLQRSVKILGTFAKQPIARGRMHYLDFIPPTLESVRRCLDELPDFAALGTLLPMDFSIEAARGRLERRH